MFKIEIIADNATELKEKLDGLVEMFGVGQLVVNNVVVDKDPKALAEAVDQKIEKAVESKLEEKATESKLEEKATEDVVEAEETEESEEVEDNLATKMTYWLLGEEFGSSRKGQEIPVDAQVFASKAAWEAAQDEVKTTTETNFPVEDAEPVDKSTIVTKMGDLLRNNGAVKAELTALLARFDVAKFGQMDEKHYAEFYEGLLLIEKGGN